MSKVQVDVELMDTPAFRKAAKHMGDKNAKEMIERPKEDLEKIIIDCELSAEKIRQATQQNSSYKAAMSVKKDLEGGMRSALAPINSKKVLAVLALKSKNDHQE